MSNESAIKYTTSEVEIPIREENNIYSQKKSLESIPPSINFQDNIMLSKRMNFKSNQFMPSIPFINKNIHHLKTTIPKKFLGSAVMDPNHLHINQNIIRKIYCQQTFDCPNINEFHKNGVQQSINNFNENSTSLDVSESDLSLTNDHDNVSFTSSLLHSEGNSDIEDNDENYLFSDDIINGINKGHDFNKNILFHKSMSAKKKGNEITLECNDATRKNNNEIVLTNNNIDGKKVNNFPNLPNYNENPKTVPQQESIIILDENHFENLSNLHHQETSFSICDSDYKDNLELVQILMKHNIPLNKIYNEIINWRHKKSLGSRMTIPTLIDKAEHRVYGKSISAKMKPILTNLTCPSGVKITVTSFDIDALIFDMLNDDNLTQHENMIFVDGNHNNPFIVNNKSHYGDIDQSEFYQQTNLKLNIDSTKEIHVPIQLYLDETTLDNYSKLSLHPLAMTLLIYNRKTQNLSMSWRTLAYIPNFQEIVFQHCKYTVDQRHGDFHFCLRYLMNGIEKLQKLRSGYNWTFHFKKFPNKSFKRKLIFTVGNVLGDAKGANVLCSRYGNNTLTTHLSRDCNVLTKDSDNPKCRCIFHKQKELNQLTHEELNQLSFRKATPYNAFCEIDFGSNIYGINGSCAADPCHMFNKGVVERLPEIFMARLSPKLIKVLDRHVGSLVTNYSNQSDRDFPNIKRFSKGVSSSAKLRSEENISRVLVIFFVLLTIEFEKELVGKKGRKENKDTPASKITLSEYNEWILIFEETLILHCWIYLDKHPKSVFKGGKNSIACDRLREYMNTYKSNALRKEGNGLKFLKFHQILHLWWIIRMFGSLYNVDTARCESHHKKKKVIGNQTQRRIDLFDEQTANGEYKFNLLVKAMQKANMKIPKHFETECPSSVSAISKQCINTDIKYNNGSKFILTFDYKLNTLKSKWLSSKQKTSTPNFQSYVLNAFFDKFKGYNNGLEGKRIKSINGFTELRLTHNQDNVIRACPHYRNEKDWFDWVTVTWEDEGIVDCQCLLFVDFSTITLEEIDDDSEIQQNFFKKHDKVFSGKAVLVHSVLYEDFPQYKRKCFKKSCTPIDDANYVRNRLVRFCAMEDTYQIIDVNNIHSTSFVIPYEYSDLNEVFNPQQSTECNGCNEKT